MKIIKWFIAGVIGGIGVNLLNNNTYYDFWMNLIGILLITVPMSVLSHYEGYIIGKKIKMKEKIKI